MNESTTQLLPAQLVDAHVHLWDLERLRLPWLGPPLNRSFLLSDYAQATRGLNVRQAVYVEVGVEASQRFEEADLAVSLCRTSTNPLAGVVMSGDVAYGHFLRYVEGYPVRRWVKGVRQALPEDLRPTSPFVRGVRRLGEMNIRFELNTDPARALQLIECCPETRFVIDHCGGATFDMLADERRMSEWARLMRAISRHDNVACKLSGIVSTAPAGKWQDADFAPVFAHLLRTFGPERLMFASDWPICTLSSTLLGWVQTVAHLLQDCSEAERAAIFHDTARRWYDLEGA